MNTKKKTNYLNKYKKNIQYILIDDCDFKKYNSLPKVLIIISSTTFLAIGVTCLILYGL